MEWTKPELIVLARSQPEEAVLAVCKTNAYGASDACTVDGWCNYYDDTPTSCAFGNCNVNSAS